MSAAVTAAAIGAGAQAFNAWQTGKTNRATREFTGHMYNIQRGHSLQDWEMQNRYNEEMWNKNNMYNQSLWNQQNSYNQKMWEQQNRYDSPQEQMRRFKEAGINPNAMFGNMSGGQAMDASKLVQASASSGATKSSPTPSPWSPRPAQLDGSGFISSILDTQFKGAQVDNLKKQSELLTQEAILKSLDITGKQISNQTGELNKNLLYDTYHSSVQAAAQNLKKMTQDFNISANQEARNQDLHPRNMDKIGAEINNLRENNKLLISNQEALELQKSLHRYEKILNDMGVQKNDNMLFRFFGTMINKPLTKDGQTLLDMFKGTLNSIESPDWRKGQ